MRDVVVGVLPNKRIITIVHHFARIQGPGCYGAWLTWKDTVTKKKRERMFFGTFLDRNGDWLDTVHFPGAARNYPLQGSGFYRMRGKILEEFGVYSVDVQFMEKVGLKKVR